jgi:hypothetical protein
MIYESMLDTKGYGLILALVLFKARDLLAGGFLF